MRGAQLLGHTEVTDFNVTRLVDQNVVKLDIAMYNKFTLVNILQTSYNLLEEVAGVVFFEAATFANIR